MDSSTDRMILGDELIPFLKERLAAGQTVRYLPFRGFSMLPMLRQGKDMVELSPLPHKLKKYDLPVYQCPSGKVVMHRVVAVKEDHYVCLGDNTYSYETITPDQMIAVVSAFKRGDRRIEVTSCAYQLYCRIWCAMFPLRKLLHWAIQLIKRVLRRLLK